MYGIYQGVTLQEQQSQNRSFIESLAALDPFEPLIAAGPKLIYGEDFQMVILHHAVLHSLVNNIKNVDKWTWTQAAAVIITFAHDSVSLVLLLIFCGDNY